MKYVLVDDNLLRKLYPEELNKCLTTVDGKTLVPDTIYSSLKDRLRMITRIEIDGKWYVPNTENTDCYECPFYNNCNIYGESGDITLCELFEIDCSLKEDKK